MRWMDMTRPDFEALPADVALVWPLGSTEQHGEHLPVGTDTLIVTDLVERIERAQPDRVLLLPTLPVGASHHHRAFPGAISLPEGIYSAVLQEAVGGLIESDVCAPGRAKRILLLNAHGGNIAPGQAALSEIAWRWRARPEVIVAFTSYWVATADAIAKVPMETPALTHACEYETSMVLALAGQLVHMERARAKSMRWEGTRFTPDASRPPTVSVAAPFHARSANGALGRPDLATAEKGRLLLDAIAADLIAFIDEFIAWPDLVDAREKG